MICPWCSADQDRVVDSRAADSGSSIRRRRECLSCKRRYTTFERIEDVGLSVVKRDGTKYPFDREKVFESVMKASKNRPVTPYQAEELASHVEEQMLRKGPAVTSEQIGLAVLADLAKLDQVAYMRFASVYKDFQEIGDFTREVSSLQKKIPAKDHRPSNRRSST